MGLNEDIENRWKELGSEDKLALKTLGILGSAEVVLALTYPSQFIQTMIALAPPLGILGMIGISPAIIDRIEKHFGDIGEVKERLDNLRETISEKIHHTYEKLKEVI